MSVRGTKRASGVRGEEAGPSKRRDEPGPSKRRDEAGPSKRRDEPGPSKRRDEAGPSKRRDEVGPSKRRDEAGPSKRRDEAGPSKRRDEAGPSKRRDEAGPSKRREEAGPSKRRRTEQDDALWQLRPVSDLKMSSIYNRSASEAPAELFRKDLISAMKLPDSEPLTSSEYWVITDTWKQDWERGVQVPVNPDSLPAPKVKIIDNPLPPNFTEFKLPKDKYIHLCRDVQYQPEKHQLSKTPARAEAACSYDLDAVDSAWLKLLNAERARAGVAPVTEDQFERVIEELEVRTWDKIQAIMKSEEGLGIEYDENVICDVCRSPDSEDGNEMVFCDSCNICVHQACYGITVIPDGQWLCRPCGDSVRPTCVLCPNQGGAMKCTPSGHKWAHVSCVLWIPEVSIGCAENMEPITKISAIPASRWSLVCVLCRERKGACIQCSVKTCKTAYHVTCAFKHGLEMRAIIEDENADDGVKLRSYCQKHSVNSKKEKCPGSGSEEESEVKRKRRKDMTSEEKSQARAARLVDIEGEFDRHVSVKDISTHLLEVDQDSIGYMYNYWKLKRRAGRNRPLLPPKSDDNELLTHRQEQADLDKMRKFVQLRQDLERVRNLCYMVSRREKLSRSFFRMREQTFHKQVAVLSAEPAITGPDLAAILQANHGPSIYDRLYSHPNAPDHKTDFNDLLARIAPLDSGDDKKKDRNGLSKGSKNANNPYKKHYVNGGSRRSGSMYSGLSSEESAPEVNRSAKYRGRAIGSSTEEDVKKSPRKKVSPKAKGKRSPKKIERKKKVQSKAFVDSSSEDDDSLKDRMKKDRSRSKTLQQMEKEMAAGKLSATDTDDDIITMKSTRNSKFPVDIYSDSSEDLASKSDVKPEKNKTDKVKTETGKSEKTKPEKSPHDNDSQQQLPRTKAAMKEFIPSHSEKKTTVKEEDKPAPKKRGRKPSSNKDVKKTTVKINESDDEAKNKENIKFSKQKDNPTDMIVPQRQAAKKASENMRSTTTVTTPTSIKKEEPVSDKPVSGDDTKSKPKVKSKDKEVKEVVPAKVGRKKSSKETEKEPIAYVPQRQAAKKAAAHIKSGLGTKLPVPETEGEKKKDNEKSDGSKLSPKKEDSKQVKTPQNESSSSSNTSSSSYSSSSSSEEEEEEEKPPIKPSAKAREIKPAPRLPSLFSPQGPRPTVDLPFLDKVSRPLSSTSASSDSDSSRSRNSGSSSPTIKRPRRRRKGKSLSTDTSPVKAPDKKLKTSEMGSEHRVPSPTAEGEKRSRPGDARAATRARTRSTTSSGNMPNKSDTRQRKPSKDDAGIYTGPNKTPKASGQSSQLPTPERKANEEIKQLVKDEPPVDSCKTEPKAKTPKGKRRSVSIEEKIKSPEIHVSKMSPKKSAELRYKTTPNRRMSVKDLDRTKEQKVHEESVDSFVKGRRLSRHDIDNISDRVSVSPVKKPIVHEKNIIDIVNKNSPPQLSPPRLHDEHPDDAKSWIPKAPSPSIQPPPIERPGTHEKYMTEDKSMDSDSAEKSSDKMIAKIQATLNENPLIKSPKTPMDARTADSLELDPLRNMRKRSVLDSDKKFMTQDASHVHGVEISKSAKIPSAVNQFAKSITSNEMFGFEMFGVDDGINHDDVMKPFASYPEFLFKEDSKDQGVQETKNLVDRLRMQMISKKMPAENSEQDDPIIVNDDEEHKDEINDITSKSLSVDSIVNKNLDIHRHSKEHRITSNHVQCNDLDLPSKDGDIPLPMTSNDKWPDLPVRSEHDELLHDRRKYDHSVTYHDDVKEPATVQSDVQSNSEVGDTISLSKQSDDSQSLSVVDHSQHSNDHDQDLTNYDNNNSVAHSECPTPSPYISQETPKWRESKITTRRSSASSTNSEGSVCSQKTDIKSQMTSCDSHQDNVIGEMESYPALPAYSCPPEQNMPMSQYGGGYGPDGPTFLSGLGGLPLFGTGASQLPLHSPGPPLYSPFAPSPLIQPLAKSSFPTLCAAFTSSSQNIALTTAMVAPPTPKPTDSPRDDIDVTGSDKFSIHVVSSPSISVDSYNENSSRAPTKMSNDSQASNDTVSNLLPQESKSPKTSSANTTPSSFAKTMPRFSSKSPGKSPGISPKQSEAPKSTKRSGNRNNRGNRGRGRSKSRGHGFPPVDYMGNSIQSKLVGTVYDFNEESANDGVDLKALRERRKSIDIRDDRKSENSYKGASPSPRVVSPPQSKRTLAESKDVKSPARAISPTSPARKSVERIAGAGFSSVAPLLPGPVDMRTYQPFEAGVPVAAAAASSTFHTHLLASFASGTADQHLAEIDEEDEKQLQTALASKHGPDKPAVPPPPLPKPVEPVKEPTPPQLPKVSLSDSRNQLKVKIKGPFLDANYSSSVTPVVPLPAAPPEPPAISAISSGSGNLRRMRKKELLRQYWNQDMNQNEAPPPPPPAPPPLARQVITIPKAVASMTCIPTREDYRLSESPIEKKKRKVSSGLSRELRHLEVSMNDDVDPAEEAKLTNFSNSSNHSHKRRGRVSNKPNRSALSPPITPKLKIKIGSGVVQPVGEEPLGFQIKPPKKRLMVAAATPSYEDLRRESMKYRRMVMADFAETEKTKKTKPSKSEKRKKKKDKKAEKLQVVNSESESAPKLIIKIKRPKEEETGVEPVPLAAPVPADPFEYDPSAPDPLAIDPPSYGETSSAMRKIRTAKVTPIRLKLARSSQGSGYDVMPSPADGAPAPAAPPASPPLIAPEPAPGDPAVGPASDGAEPVPVAFNKHCKVR